MSRLDPLGIRKTLGRKEWLAPTPWGPQGWKFVRIGGGSVIVSVSEFPGNTLEWIHASIAYPDRTPTYDDLVLLHQAVFRDGYAYQVFAPAAKHVNIHVNALHLYGRFDGEPALPDFAPFGSI